MIDDDVDNNFLLNFEALKKYQDGIRWYLNITPRFPKLSQD